LAGTDRPHNEPDARDNGGSDEEQDKNDVAFHKLIVAPSYALLPVADKSKKLMGISPESMRPEVSLATPVQGDRAGRD
jgi:hypothetical protein